MTAILTIGNFDGLHIGHRHLIQITIDLARSWATRAIAITFTPHPKQFFSPTDHFYIYPQKIKENILNSLGLDDVIYLPFQNIYKLSPDEFFNTVILPLEPDAIVLGENFTFGTHKSGNIHMLRKMCAEHDIAFHSLSMEPYLGAPVSSTRIRQAIQEGNISIANEMLGVPYTLYGTVEQGAHRGHTIGFPTANIHPDDQVLPKCGAYATFVSIDNSTVKFPAITAVTHTPTFAQVKTVVETHILNFDQSLYGHRLSVQIMQFMRDEISFASKDELIEQLKKDCIRAQNILLSDV